MRYTIDVQETITRINRYVIDVSDDEEAERILSEIEYEINNANHPDDVLYAISNVTNIQEIIEGAEECSYEIW